MAALNPSKSTKDSEDFWSRNNGGIPVGALFGDKGGAGEIGRRIAASDVNGDGHLSKVEFRNAIEGAVNDAQSTKLMKKALLVVLGFSLLLLISIFGLVLAVTELSKEMNVKGDVMMVKGTDEPVKMASTDFTPASVGAGSSASGSLVNAADNSLVSTSEALVYAPLSSVRSDDDMAQLKTVVLTSGRVSMHLRVSGFVRTAGEEAYPPVMLITMLGKAKLEGDLVTFRDADATAFLTESGFTTMANGTLAGEVEGGFNQIPAEI